MPSTTTEWVTVTRADVEAMRTHPNATSDGHTLCMVCEGTTDSHDADCRYANGLDAMIIHRDYLSDYALVRTSRAGTTCAWGRTDTTCLLCGRTAYEPEQMSECHDGDCSLAWRAL